MRAKVFFLSLFGITMLTSCNYSAAIEDSGYIEENQNEPEQEIQDELKYKKNRSRKYKANHSRKYKANQNRKHRIKKR